MDAPERPKRRAKAELPPLAELVGRRHKDVEPTDPVFIVATIVEELQRQALTEMGELVTGLADQIAAASLMAENAAKAKAERIVAQATEFAATRITEAGEAAAARFTANTQQELADARKQLSQAVSGVWISAAVAACSAIGSVAVLWR